METKAKNRAQQRIQSFNISNHVEIPPEGPSGDYGYYGQTLPLFN